MRQSNPHAARTHRDEEGGEGEGDEGVMHTVIDKELNTKVC